MIGPVNETSIDKSRGEGDGRRRIVCGFETVIRGVVSEVWRAILGLEVSEGESAFEAARKIATERSLTSCIQVTGTFEGTVLVCCSHRLAEKMAAIMFDVGEVELSNEEIEDATGELGNMVAGNIKLMLPEPSEISLPAVINGLDYRLIVPKSKECGKIVFECQGEPILVSLLQKESELLG
jgi:chemotaxis protein CheX